MCIIVSKEKNKNIPSREILENCFNNNSDGAGFMYVLNKNVHIEKGFMNFESFYNRIIELDKKINLKKRSLVMHFRIGTSGKNDAETCHPFPISNNFNDLRTAEIVCKIGMVHNGIISSFAYDTVLSDTQNYVKDFVYNLYKLNKNFLRNKYTKNILNTSCNHTKLAFLDNNDHIYYFGDFVKDENGIKYSNTTYQATYYKNYVNYNGRKYFNNYNDYCKYYDYEEDYIKADDDIEETYYYYIEDVAILNNSLCYLPNATTSAEFKECSDKMCVDEDYNLYEILQEENGIVKVKLIDVDIIIFDDQMEELTFTKLQKIQSR